MGRNFGRKSMHFPKKIRKEQNVRVNPDTAYLNIFIKYTKEKKFEGLNNAMLKELGK